MRQSDPAMVAVIGRPASGGPTSSNHGDKCGDEVGAVREPGDQTVDRVNGELVLDELHEEGQGGARLAGVTLRRFPFGLVGEGRLVAVVAVGDQHGVVRDGRGDGRTGGGIVDPPDGVADAILVDDGGERRLVHREEVGEALREGEAPDRRRSRHERRRSRRSLFAFLVVCSWGRMSVPGRVSSRAPITPVVSRSTPSSPVRPCGTA